MGDRSLDSSYKANVEEGVVAVKADTQTINQLSSSGRAAQYKRMGKALESLANAAPEQKAPEQKAQEQKAQEQKAQEQNDKSDSGQ